MEKPDVELELVRDEGGLITGMSYKVNEPGDEGKRAIEFTSMAEAILGPAPIDTNVVLDAVVALGDMSE